MADEVGHRPRVLLDNDVTVAALGEATHGAGKHTADFLAVWVGTGVGGAVVLDGKVRRGVTGARERSGTPPCGRWVGRASAAVWATSRPTPVERRSKRRRAAATRRARP